MPFTNNSIDDLLDQAIEAVKASPIEECPPAHVISATKTALAGAADLDSQVTRLSRPERQRKTSWRGSLAFAATLLIAVGVTAMLWSPKNAAFAAVLAKLQESSTVALRMSIKLGAAPMQEGRLLLDSTHMRIELFDGMLVTIADLNSHRSIQIDRTQKTGQITDLDDKTITAFSEVIQSLRNAKPDDAKLLGQQTVDGRITDIFELSDGKLLGMSGIAEMRVWVDHQTQLPTKIVAEDLDPKAEMRMVLDDLKWGVEIPQSQFVVALPEGYRQIDARVVKAAADSSQPTTAATRTDSTLLSDDRVPRSIAWDKTSNSLTALLTDPENTDVRKHRSAEIRQWDMKESKLRWTKPVSSGSMFASASAGNRLAFAIGREIQIVSAHDGELKSTLVSKFVLPTLSLSRSGEVLAAAGADWQAAREKRLPSGFIEVWNLAKNEKLCELVDDDLTTFVALAPNGESFVSSSNNGPVKLWRVADGKLLHIFDGVLRATYAPSSEHLAVASNRGRDKAQTASIAIYKLSDFSLERSMTLPQVKSSILSLEYAPDGQHLATGSWDGHLIIWDLSQSDTAPLTRHIDAGIHSLAFSPDGQQLATGSEEGALRIWNVR